MKIFIGERLFLSEVKKAKHVVDRLKGLMFSSHMMGKDGFLIPNCNWIHTFFMKFSIDVIYLNEKYEVVDIDTNVSPWIMCLPRLKARHVLELKGGSLGDGQVSIGEVLRCIA